jgi:hypothetical protein
MNSEENNGEASSAQQSGGELPQSTTEPQSKPSMELGPQPLDKIMEDLGLKNHDLVAKSTDGLTHKQVKKGRNGRRLTRNLKEKITGSLCAATDKEYRISDLFNY